MIELGIKEGLALADYIFGNEHVPVWEPRFRAHYKTLPSVFPTRKNPRGFVHSRLPLMRHGLVHFDTDPAVVSISAFPFSIDYWSASTDGERMKRPHTPDVVIRLKDGRVVVIDFVPVAIQNERPWQAANEAQLVAQYREMGWSYAVHDERCVYQEPMFGNAMLMWRYKPDAADPPIVTKVREAVLSAPMPLQVSAISDFVAGIHPRFASDRVALWSNVFTAAMQLVMEGKLSIDLSRPITSLSMISGKENAA